MDQKDKDPSSGLITSSCLLRLFVFPYRQDGCLSLRAIGLQIGGYCIFVGGVVGAFLFDLLENKGVVVDSSILGGYFGVCFVPIMMVIGIWSFFVEKRVQKLRRSYDQNQE